MQQGNLRDSRQACLVVGPVVSHRVIQRANLQDSRQVSLVVSRVVNLFFIPWVRRAFLRFHQLFQQVLLPLPRVLFVLYVQSHVP